MSEPQAPNELTPTTLGKDEINTASRIYRGRLGKALTNYPAVMLLVTRGIWREDQRTETIDWPRENPAWRHKFSRTSNDLIVYSEFLSEEDVNADSLHMYLPEDNPGISFTKFYRGNAVARPDSTSDVLPAADAVIGRIEQQLKPKSSR